MQKKENVSLTSCARFSSALDAHPIPVLLLTNDNNDNNNNNKRAAIIYFLRLID
jgi:hypothetical protein